ncbi:hypothetical protein D3C86_283660 [compost metagenome]
MRFPGGAEARTPPGGRPGGQQPPRFWGLPIPTRREARREGDGPFLGHADTGAARKVSSGGAALAAFGSGGRGAQGGRGQRPAAPRGDAFPPPGGALRRRGGGLKLGVQAGAAGVGAEGAQRPEGRRIGLRDEPAPRARLSLKPKKPIYTYWVPFSVLAKSRFRYWRTDKMGRAKTLFGLGPKLGLVPIWG